MKLIKKTIRCQGFTLWEVLLVLVILGCVAFIGIPKFNNNTEHAKAEAHKTNLMIIDRAIQLYYLDIGQYPETLDVLVKKPEQITNWRGPYLEETPLYPYDPHIRYEVQQGKVQTR